MRVAVSDDGNTLKETKIVPTPPNFEEGIQTLKQVSDELSTGEKIDGAAGGVAGVLDKSKTQLIQSSHVTNWVNKPLKQELEEIFGTEVKLENDADIEGLGEALKGAGMGKKIVAYITIGTGVGGVRIVNGQIDQNALGFEPGHQIIVPEGNPCDCGGKGHLETYIGGSYLEKIHGQKAENITNPAVWDEVSKSLAIGLTNTIVHWSPEIVILGGSVSESIPLDKVQEYLKQNLTVFPQVPQVVLATLGQDAGFYGALELLK